MATLLLKDKGFLDNRLGSKDEPSVIGICSESPLEILKFLVDKYHVSEYKSRHLYILSNDNSARNGTINIQNQDSKSSYPSITSILEDIEPFKSPRAYTPEEREDMVISSSDALVYVTHAHSYIAIVHNQGPHRFGGKPNGIFNYLEERKKKQNMQLEGVLKETLELQDALLGTGDVEYLRILVKPMIKGLKQHIKNAAAEEKKISKKYHPGIIRRTIRRLVVND